MKEVYERLLVSDLNDCSFEKNYDSEWAIVHACKTPCHQRAVGYTGNLKSNHPNYLILVRDKNLYMNLIDPPIPLFKDQSFNEFMRFAEDNWNRGRKILIHCNQGLSRAPSLALLFLSKKVKTISNNSYQEARKDFLEIYPDYLPGLGIQKFLTENWNSAAILG